MSKTVSDYADRFATLVGLRSRLVRGDAPAWLDKATGSFWEPEDFDTPLSLTRVAAIDTLAESIPVQAGSFGDLAARLRMLATVGEVFGLDHPLVGKVAEAFARDHARLTAARKNTG